MIKKIVLVTSVTSGLLLSASAMAGAYISGGVGFSSAGKKSSVDAVNVFKADIDNNTGFAYGGSLGYMFFHPASQSPVRFEFGVEANFLKYGDADTSITAGSLSTLGKLKQWGVAPMAVAKVYFGQLYAIGKAGWQFNDAQFTDIAGISGANLENTWYNNFAFGFGIGFDILKATESKPFGFGVNVMYHGAVGKDNVATKVGDFGSVNINYPFQNHVMASAVLNFA